MYTCSHLGEERSSYTTSPAESQQQAKALPGALLPDWWIDQAGGHEIKSLSPSWMSFRPGFFIKWPFLSMEMKENWGQENWSPKLPLRQKGENQVWITTLSFWAPGWIWQLALETDLLVNNALTFVWKLYAEEMRWCLLLWMSLGSILIFLKRNYSWVVSKEPCSTPWPPFNLLEKFEIIQRKKMTNI